MKYRCVTGRIVNCLSDNCSIVHLGTLSRSYRTKTIINNYNHCRRYSLLGTLKFVDSLWLVFPAELVGLEGAHEMQQMNETETVDMCGDGGML